MFIAWATARPDDCVVGVYDTATGEEQATVAARCSVLPRTGAAYASNNTTAGVGPLLLDGGSVSVVDGAIVTAVVDQVYGTFGGSAVKIGADGDPTLLPNGTLIPVAESDEHLLIVDSKQKLSAVLRDA